MTFESIIYGCSDGQGLEMRAVVVGDVASDFLDADGLLVQRRQSSNGYARLQPNNWEVFFFLDFVVQCLV